MKIIYQLARYQIVEQISTDDDIKYNLGETLLIIFVSFGSSLFKMQPFWQWSILRLNLKSLSTQLPQLFMHVFTTTVIVAYYYLDAHRLHFWGRCYHHHWLTRSFRSTVISFRIYEVASPHNRNLLDSLALLSILERNDFATKRLWNEMTVNKRSCWHLHWFYHFHYFYFKH